MTVSHLMNQLIAELYDNANINRYVAMADDCENPYGDVASPGVTDLELCKESDCVTLRNKRNNDELTILDLMSSLSVLMLENSKYADFEVFMDLENDEDAESLSIEDVVIRDGFVCLTHSDLD